MRYGVLGPLEVREGERPLSLGGAKQRALLAVLLLNANDVVSVDRLLSELWGESPPATALSSVHVYVSRLRRTLGPGAIETRPPGYLIRVGAGELDLDRFEELVARGDGDSLRRGARSLAWGAARRLRIRGVRTGRHRPAQGAAAGGARAADRGRPRAR